jgi:hypothetical protein
MNAATAKQVAIIGIAALLLLGPASADPSDDLAGPPGGPNGGPTTDKDSDFNNIEIVDAALESKLELVRVGSNRGANNLLGVFAGIRNKTARRLELEIETIYKDQAGNELNTGSWIPVTLPPHEQQDYRSSAISEAAVDFLIRVRRARQSH